MPFPNFGEGMPVVPDAFLPDKQPDTSAPYSYDASGDVTLAEGETVASASFAVSPSGAGEAVPTSLSVAGLVATVTISGGVPGRNYVDRLTLVTTASHTYEIIIGQVCSAVLATEPVPPAPDPGFGTPVTWAAGP